MHEQQPIFVTAWSRVALVVFIICLIVFFVQSNFLVSQFNTAFNSPDEAANYYFIKQFKEKSNFFLAAPSADDLPGTVRPRSFLRTGSSLIPVSFLGFPLLLGSLAKIFTMKGIAYFIFTMSALMVLAWYGFLKTIFGRQVALLSSLLLLVHPAFVYYSLRPFSPNILFVDFLVFAAYFFVKILTLHHIKFPVAKDSAEIAIPLTSQAPSKQRFFSLLFGLTFGLALVIRPSEVFWLFCGLFLIFIFARKDLSSFSPVFALCGLLLPLATTLFFQKATYGQFFSTGYYSTAVIGQNFWKAMIKSILLPFGLDLGRSWQVFREYFFNIFYPFSLLLFFCLVIMVFRANVLLSAFRRKINIWLIILVFSSIFLAIYYGSWHIHDRLDSKTSIGVSFIRYFLPLYFLTIPIISFGLMRLSRFLRLQMRMPIFLFVVMLVFWSLHRVWLNGDESILSILRVLNSQEAIRANLLQIVPKSDIVISERGDKIFFPYREVIGEFRSPKALQDVKDLVKEHGLWYETYIDDDAIAIEKAILWEPLGLGLGGAKLLGKGHTLYKIVKN